MAEGGYGNGLLEKEYLLQKERGARHRKTMAEVVGERPNKKQKKP